MGMEPKAGRRAGLAENVLLKSCEDYTGDDTASLQVIGKAGRVSFISIND